MAFRSKVFFCVLLLVLPTAIASGSSPSLAAQALPEHTGLVPVTPRTDTPRIATGHIYDIEVIGTRVYLAGTFTQIRNFDGVNVAQPYLAAYDINSGRLDMGFRPVFPSEIQAIESSPDGTGLFVGGRFNSVSGIARQRIVKLNPTTGAVVTAFTANANARATAIAVSDNYVYVGGQFTRVNGVVRGGMVALNPTTGAVDAGFNLPITEGIGGGGALTVHQLKLTHDLTKLLVVHTGRKVAGIARTGVALIDTATKSLNPWQTDLFDDNLIYVGGTLRIAAGDISPDDSYFVVTSGSGGDRPPLNDTAIAFPIAGTTGVEPIWISRHFDSVYSVAISETAVYVGGHFRFQESHLATQPWPGDRDESYGWGSSPDASILGDEVVRRDTLGALDPATGTALGWNPGANPFQGVRALELHPRGLFVGQDGTMIGQQSIGRHGFFDRNVIPPTSAAETWIDYPFDGLTLYSQIPYTFEGRASATAGVQRVQIEIRNRDNNQYLQDDLTTWSLTWNGINATLATPGATSTTWSIPLDLAVGGRFVWSARTFATSGGRDAVPASATFEVRLSEDEPPTSTITAPIGNVITNTFMMTGAAFDDFGVARMSISIRSNDTDMYQQDDGTMAPLYNSFSFLPDTPGEIASLWEYEVTLPNGFYKIEVSVTDNRGQGELRGAARDIRVAGANLSPTVTVLSPASTTVEVEPGTQLTLSGTATDDTFIRAVEISISNAQTREGVQIDGTWGRSPRTYRFTPFNLASPLTYDWSYTTPPLPIGSYAIKVRSVDEHNFSTPTTSQPTINTTAKFAADALPNTTLDFATTTQDIDTLVLPITGTASDDAGVSGVKIAVYDSYAGKYLTNAALGTTDRAYAMLDATVASPGATSTTFALTLNLPIGGNYAVIATAVDSAGQFDTTTTGATAKYLIFPGDSDPTLNMGLQQPLAGQTFTNFAMISGRAEDDTGIEKVEIQIVNSTNMYLKSDGTFTSTSTWIAAFLTNPGGVGSNYNYTTPNLVAGIYTFSVRATDTVGQVMAAPHSVSVTIINI